MSFQVGELFYTIGVNPGEFEKLERELRRKEKQLSGRAGMTIKVNAETKQAFDQINELANRVRRIGNQFKIGDIVPDNLKAELDSAIRELRDAERKLAADGNLTESSWRQITGSINEANQAYRNYERTAAKSSDVIAQADKRVTASIQQSKEALTQAQLARSQGNMTNEQYVSTLRRLQSVLGQVSASEQMSVNSSRQLARAQLDLQKAIDSSNRSNKLQETFYSGAERRVTVFRAKLSTLRTEYDRGRETIGKYLTRLKGLENQIVRTAERAGLSAGEHKKLADILRQVTNEAERERVALNRAEQRAGGRPLANATKGEVHNTQAISRLSREVSKARFELDEFTTSANMNKIGLDQVTRGAATFQLRMINLKRAIRASNLPMQEQSKLIKQLNVDLRKTQRLYDSATGSLNRFALSGQVAVGVGRGLSNVMLVGLGPAGYRVALAMDVAASQAKVLKRMWAEAAVAGGRLAIVLGAIFAVMATLAGIMLFMSTKAGVEIESALADVRKTTGLADRELKGLRDTFMSLSTELPNTTLELLEYAKVAGQLGIRGKANIEAFTETIAMLATATDVVGEEGATQLARFLQATGVAAEDMGRKARVLGNVLNELENSTAATAGQILQTTQYTGQLAARFRLTQPEVLGLGAAILSVGQKAEASGTAMSKTFSDIEAAAVNGGEDLEKMAGVAGLTADEFRNLANASPIDALDALLGGMNKVVESGGSLTGVMESLGFNEERQQRVVASLAAGYDKFVDSIEIARKETFRQSSLQREVNIRLDTARDKLKILRNQFSLLAQVIGNKVLPAFSGFISLLSQSLDGWLEFFGVNHLSTFQEYTDTAEKFFDIFSEVKTIDDFTMAMEGVEEHLTGEALEAWEDYREGLDLTKLKIDEIPDAVRAAVAELLAIQRVSLQSTMNVARETFGREMAKTQRVLGQSDLFHGDFLGVFAGVNQLMQDDPIAALEFLNDWLEAAHATFASDTSFDRSRSELARAIPIFTALREHLEGLAGTQTEYNELLREEAELFKLLGGGRVPNENAEEVSSVLKEIREGLADVNDLERLMPGFSAADAMQARIDVINQGVEKLIRLDPTHSSISILTGQLEEFKTLLDEIVKGPMRLQRPIINARRMSAHDLDHVGGTHGEASASEIEEAIRKGRLRNAIRAGRIQDAIRLERILSDDDLSHDFSDARVQEYLRLARERNRMEAMHLQRLIINERKLVDSLTPDNTDGGIDPAKRQEYIDAAQERNRIRARRLQNDIRLERMLSENDLNLLGGTSGGSAQPKIDEYVAAGKARTEAQARRIQDAIRLERILADDDLLQGGAPAGMTPDDVIDAIEEAKTPAKLVDVLNQLHGQLDDTTVAGREMKAMLEELGLEYDITLDPIAALENKVDELEESFKITTEEAEILRKIIAELRKDMEKTETTMDKVLKAINSVGNSLGGVFSDFAQVTTDLAEGATKIAGGDILGGVLEFFNVIVKMFQMAKETREFFEELKDSGVASAEEIKQAWVDTFFGFRDGLGFLRKELELSEQFSIIDPESLIQSKMVTKGALWWKKTVEVVNEGATEIRVAIASAIEGGFLGGFRGAIQAWLDGTQSLATGIKEAIYSAVLDGIIDAIIQGAILEGALGDLFSKITEAAAKGDWEEVGRLTGKAMGQVEGIAVEVEKALDPVLKHDPSPDTSPNGPSGGAQISEITGPTRDLLVDLLSPLASLDSLVGAFNSGFEVNLGVTNDHLGNILAVNTQILNSVRSTPLGASGSVTYNINVNAPKTSDPDAFGGLLAKLLAREIRHTQKVAR